MAEQRHHRFKRTLDQALMLRGSRDFADTDQDQEFLAKLFAQLNSGLKEKLSHEIEALRPLPDRRVIAPRGYASV